MITIAVFFTILRVIRLTTPSLNFLIICGALLMYLSVLIKFAPSTEKGFIKAQCIVSELSIIVNRPFMIEMDGPVAHVTWRRTPTHCSD